MVLGLLFVGLLPYLISAETGESGDARWGQGTVRAIQEGDDGDKGYADLCG